MRNRKEKLLRAVVYLSAKGNEKTVEQKEKNQLKYIREYAKAHNIQIVKVMHRNIMGNYVVNTHFQKMVEMIGKNEVEVILVSKISGIATNLEDAYRKIGKVIQSGGCIVTVDEGEMKLPIQMAITK
jgi:DNA invertase Pin-like site-specific DNA recombinase